MVRSGDGRHGDTESDGSNLCAVQEVCAQEADWYKEAEQVDEKCCSNGCSFVVRKGGCDGQRYHAKAHASATDDEAEAASEPVNGEECDKAGQKFPGEHAAGKDTSNFTTHTKAFLEDGG